ncbi:phage major capsid protein [Aedoeadaptatus coxii]|uniref:phage major capsid family protein n=1 Tax=Aedoeadaptatus coxii TaxID=755172 RepID=UPI002AD1DAA6|nr:phage major capsid protein [Peptoniphilus coxii]
MADVLSRNNLFNAELVTDLINKVKGRSSLATLSGQKGIPFNGTEQFIFSMDSDIDIVAENGKKAHGGVTLEPVTIVPLKVEYGARISDEFMYASEEVQIDMLQAFNDGFARKLAKGIDLMAIHGINPRSKTASDIIGNNCFEKKVTQSVTYTEADPDTNVEAAVGMVRGSDGEVSGLAMDSTFATALAKLKVNGVKQFPELSWGANPGTVNGLQTDVNSTVANGGKNRAIVGDFAGAFKWGYAKQIPMEIIQYGDPDGTGKDLKNYNQIYIRCEAYVGWGILVPESFAVIKEA